MASELIGNLLLESFQEMLNPKGSSIDSPTFIAAEKKAIKERERIALDKLRVNSIDQSEASAYLKPTEGYEKRKKLIERSDADYKKHPSTLISAYFGQPSYNTKWDVEPGKDELSYGDNVASNIFSLASRSSPFELKLLDYFFFIWPAVAFTWHFVKGIFISFPLNVIRTITEVIPLFLSKLFKMLTINAWDKFESVSQSKDYGPWKKLGLMVLTGLAVMSLAFGFVVSSAIRFILQAITDPRRAMERLWAEGGIFKVLAILSGVITFAFWSGFILFAAQVLIPSIMFWAPQYLPGFLAGWLDTALTIFTVVANALGPVLAPIGAIVSGILELISPSLILVALPDAVMGLAAAMSLLIPAVRMLIGLGVDTFSDWTHHFALQTYLNTPDSSDLAREAVLAEERREAAESEILAKELKRKHKLEDRESLKKQGEQLKQQGEILSKLGVTVNGIKEQVKEVDQKVEQASDTLDKVVGGLEATTKGLDDVKKTGERTHQFVKLFVNQKPKDGVAGNDNNIPNAPGADPAGPNGVPGPGAAPKVVNLNNGNNPVHHRQRSASFGH